MMFCKAIMWNTPPPPCPYKRVCGGIKDEAVAFGEKTRGKTSTNENILKKLRDKLSRVPLCIGFRGRNFRELGLSYFSRDKLSRI